MIDNQISVPISHTLLVHIVSFVLMLLLLPSFYHCCCRRRVRFCDSGEWQISDHHHHHQQGEWQIADHHQGADTVIFSSCKFSLLQFGCSMNLLKHLKVLFLFFLFSEANRQCLSNLRTCSILSTRSWS